MACPCCSFVLGLPADTKNKRTLESSLILSEASSQPNRAQSRPADLNWLWMCGRDYQLLLESPNFEVVSWIFVSRADTLRPLCCHKILSNLAWTLHLDIKRFFFCLFCFSVSILDSVNLKQTLGFKQNQLNCVHYVLCSGLAVII